MGYLLALCAAALATSKDLVSKRLSFAVDGTTSTFASFAFALPFYVILLGGLYIAGIESFAVGGAFLFYVAVRALTDSAAELCKMTAFRFGDLSVVTCFFSLSPVFLLAASPLLTGDPLTARELVSLAVVTLGSVLVAYRPRASRAPVQWRAIVLALGAAFFFALNTCFDRLAVQISSAAFAGASMTFLSAVVLSPFALVHAPRRVNLVAHRGSFLLRGGFEVAFMVLKLLALQYLTAPMVVAVQRIAILLSILAGWLFFGEKDVSRRLLGGAVILCGVVIAIW